MTDLNLAPNALIGEILASSLIVIIDDTPENVSLLELALRRAGARRVRGFTNPLEALSACAEERPDVVLLDLHMPDLDAIGVMRRLQAQLPERAFLPVIVLTADVSVESRQRVLSAGAKDFLTKPLDLTEVVLRVRNTLETATLYHRLEEHNAHLQADIDAREAALRRANAERSAMEQRVRSVIADRALSMHFQPIVDIATGAVVGAEALARFEADPPRPPNEWFADAVMVGADHELELLAVALAMEQLGSLPAGAFLSINVSPETLAAGGLVDLVGPAPDRVVVELTEHQRVDDYERLGQALDQLRATGLRIAVDDTGAGYASLRHILRLGADILKLDMAITRDVDTDPARRSLARALVAFGHDIGADIIAEGVETAAELQTLREIDIHWAQGFHLGRPAPLPWSGEWG